MKRIYRLLFVAVSLMGLGSCDKDFEQINTNPILPSDLDPGYLFSNAQFTAATSTLIYPTQIVQQMVTPASGVLEGGNHDVFYEPNSAAIYNNLFTGPVRLLVDVLNKTKENPNRSNLYNMARIWKAYVFQVLVDTYGDVPYTEAGKAYLESINLPKYDDQKAIYDDLLKEVSEATKALDPAKAIESTDLFYKGNIAQWKRLGNSLLLRLAMRYTKLDANKAKQYAVMAVDPANGAVMQSNADNAFVAFNTTFNHPDANSYQGTERANYYLGKPFVDYLKNTNDPRLSVIAIKYTNPSGTTLAAAEPGDATPANQEGMPFGYNEATIATAPGYPGAIGTAHKYSQLNRRTVARIDAPYFFITHAQTQLLLAEAVQRGFISGDVQAHYTAGVKAHMDQLKQYDATLGAIPTAAQDAYLAANPFDPAKALEQINTQYWITSFLNGSEAWANFRRSGFPALTPNPYAGKDPSVTNFVRRLGYPAREKSVNATNVAEAVGRMGPDNLGTRIFWDKQ